jgi:VCBS repeat-containing protein
MLMAGIQEADGSWTLDPSELEGLILATSETSDFTIEVEASAVETAGEGDVGVTSASLFVAFESGDGSDELDGGAGSDTILGGAGDDLILEVVDGSSNVISGDAGIDTLLLSMSSEQVTDDVRADLAALLAWMDGLEPELETEDGIDLAALGLSMSGVEQVFAVVDGIATDIASLLETSGPEAEPVVGVETMEDAAVSGQLEASDADGDALAWSVLEGPANGTLQLDASGAYTYTAHADFSGSDLFMVEVSDDDGNTAMQLVEVTIAAVADAPSLQVSVSAAAAAAGVPSTAGTAADDTLTGTAGADEIAAGDGNDLVRGDSAGSAGPLALQIVAALGDLDGSEALSIRVEGIPDDATLSAGVRHDDGSWSLEPADLAGLTLTAPDGSAFTLSVAATATESTGEKATATVELAVSVGGGALGAGNDTLRGQDGNDTIYGGGGDDLVRGGWGSDSLHDEAGNDHVHGGMGSDRITNGEGNDVVWAGQSNDTIRDGAGDDVMHGDDGNDLFVVGSGNDRYHGGDGFDTIDLSAVGVGLRIDTPARSVTGNGAETWRVEGIERFVGTAFADTFLGGHARNVFEAGGGDDTIRGGQGDDKLTGGAGRDTFSWIKDDVRNGSTDIITDFAQGDRLNIKSVLQGLTYTSLNNVVRVVDNSWGTMVSVKVDGKMHEMAKLEGFHATSATQMLAAEMILV